LVTSDRDVHVVLESKLDSILQRDFEFAFVNELIDARFIIRVEFRDFDPAIRREQIRKRLRRMLVVVFRDTQGYWNRRIGRA
jgi:hypothetical protein